MQKSTNLKDRFLKLLVTGSSGFIGSSFLQEKEENYSVKTFSFQAERLDELSLEGVDTVLHLAALVHQPDNNEHEVYMIANYKNTIDLAKKSKEQGVRHFIFMSSVKVYGEESKGTCFTEDSECHPVDIYGKSKLEAEKALLLLEEKDFVVSIIRTPLVYGPRVKANVFNIVKLLSKFSYLPFANISNQRSMVYVGNLIQLIKLIIMKRASGIFLASDLKPVSTSYFFSLISQALHKKTRLFYLPGFSFFLRILKQNTFQKLYTDLCIDASQTQKKLGFAPRYTTQEGVEKMICWYKDEH
mgnify:CR=1 FL=1